MKRPPICITVKPGEAVLHDAGSRQWLRFAQPCRTLAAWRTEEVAGVLQEVEDAHCRHPLYAVGCLAYEAAPAFDRALQVQAPDPFPLAWFGLYPACHAVRLPQLAARPPPLDWRSSVDFETYARQFARIQELIRRGDTYQVNYTYRLWARLHEDPWRFFVRLAAAHRPPYGAFIHTGDWALASLSPELFFQLQGDEILSRPMKGTRARGMTGGQDHRHAQALYHSPKERAENVMIVDMVRNDLSRIAETSSVQVRDLFAVEKYPSVWQMTTTVAARTRAGLGAIMGALFPPASITGAPKARTMQIIAALETAPRRIYTGCMGFIRPDGSMQFNVAIRTMLVQAKTRQAEYGVGGGIVADSRLAAEWAECNTKAGTLMGRPPFQLLETMRWTPRQGIFLLAEHLRRLAASARYFDFELTLPNVRARLAACIRRLPAVPCKIRLRLNRDGRITLQACPLGQPRGGVPRVALARQPVPSRDVFLYHKTTQRQIYAQARQAHPEAEDVILYNEKGQITEATIANVAVELGGRRYTPPVSCGLLAGTLRAHLLAQGKLHERIITREELRQARRIWLLNSVRGLYPVRLAPPTPGE